jgi:hypothetical protein
MRWLKSKSNVQLVATQRATSVVNLQVQCQHISNDFKASSTSFIGDKVYELRDVLIMGTEKFSRISVEGI